MHGASFHYVIHRDPQRLAVCSWHRQENNHAELLKLFSVLVLPVSSVLNPIPSHPTGS